MIIGLFSPKNILKASIVSTTTYRNLASLQRIPYPVHENPGYVNVVNFQLQKQ